MTAQELQDLAEAIEKSDELAPLRDDNGNILSTYCNIAVQRYLHLGAGYDKFGLGTKTPAVTDPCFTANEIFQYISTTAPEWIQQLDGASAKNKADVGGLVIAAHPYGGHGHVAIVKPLAPLVWSSKWNCKVPTLANVGKDNKDEGANWAFPVTDTQPAYYLLNA